MYYAHSRFTLLHYIPITRVIDDVLIDLLGNLNAHAYLNAQACFNGSTLSYVRI